MTRRRGSRSYCYARTASGARCRRRAWDGRDGVGSLFCLQHLRIEQRLDDEAVLLGERIKRMMEPWWWGR